MKECNPEGPTCVYISKIIPFPQGMRAFGRVFSGTVRSGDTVLVRTRAEDKGVLKTISSVGVCMGKEYVPIPEMPAGNTVVLGGVD